MRFIIILIVVFLFQTVPARPSGRLMMQGTYFTEAHRMGPSIGLHIYEKIFFLPLYYDGWTGLGWIQRKSGTYNWATSKHHINVHVGNFVVGGGYGLFYDPVDDTLDHGIQAKISYQIW